MSLVLQFQIRNLVTQRRRRSLRLAKITQKVFDKSYEPFNKINQQYVLDQLKKNDVNFYFTIDPRTANKEQSVYKNEWVVLMENNAKSLKFDNTLKLWEAIF